MASWNPPALVGLLYSSESRLGRRGPSPATACGADYRPGDSHELDHRVEPVGYQPRRVAAARAAPRSLDGVTLGILNNNKPNSLELQRRVVELLGKGHPVAGSVTKQKPSAAIGADGLDTYVKEVGAVITAISG